jgi:hypothetical protein
MLSYEKWRELAVVDVEGGLKPRSGIKVMHNQWLSQPKLID